MRLVDQAQFDWIIANVNILSQLGANEKLGVYNENFIARSNGWLQWGADQLDKEIFQKVQAQLKKLLEGSNEILKLHERDVSTLTNDDLEQLKRLREAWTRAIEANKGLNLLNQSYQYTVDKQKLIQAKINDVNELVGKINSFMVVNSMKANIPVFASQHQAEGEADPFADSRLQLSNRNLIRIELGKDEQPVVEQPKQAIPKFELPVEEQPKEAILKIELPEIEEPMDLEDDDLEDEVLEKMENQSIESDESGHSNISMGEEADYEEVEEQPVHAGNGLNLEGFCYTTNQDVIIPIGYGVFDLSKLVYTTKPRCICQQENASKVKGIYLKNCQYDFEGAQTTWDLIEENGHEDRRIDLTNWKFMQISVTQK